jgi:hypothetical protein
MQRRYDEAKEALKQALAIDPDYPIARDNLKKLPRLRRSKVTPEHRLINPSREEDVKQSLALYEKNEQGEVTSRTVIEKVGHAMTGTWSQRGKQPPRYRLFLNPYQDTRFTPCPSCEAKTQLRQFSLLINVNPIYPIVLDKTCRYCNACDLLIVDQKLLEDQLARNFMKTDPEAIGHDYLVIGTVDRAKWNRVTPEPSSFEQVVEYLHDFKEVVTFE